MKTPIVYYGGKTNMLKHILPLLSTKHDIYVEPFIGGGAVFFAKDKCNNEIINDNLNCCITFYQVAKNNFELLNKKVQETLHAETSHRLAKHILLNQELYSDVDIAWAFWMQNIMSFAHKLYGGFAFARKQNVAATSRNKINEFTNLIQERLQKVTIFNRNAIDVIKKFDSLDTLFYLDPPYANSDCGHYEKEKNVFYELLNLLPTLQGKWILSSYPEPNVENLRAQPNVFYQNIEKPLSVGTISVKKRKIECITWNFKV